MGPRLQNAAAKYAHDGYRGFFNLLKDKLAVNLEELSEPTTNLMIRPDEWNHEMTQSPTSELLLERSSSTGVSEKSPSESPSEGVDDDDRERSPPKLPYSNERNSADSIWRKVSIVKCKHKSEMDEATLSGWRGVL